jgi:hypothetical protein
MINHFPEIELFFKKQNFAEDKIEKLKRDIKKIYKDPKIVSLAISLVDLKLLHSLRSKAHKERIVPTKSKNETVPAGDKKSNLIFKHKNLKKIEERFNERRAEQLNSINELNNGCIGFYDLRVFNLSKKLQVSSVRIIEELQKHGFFVKETTRLKKHHIDAIQGWIKDTVLCPNQTSSVLHVNKSKGEKLKGKARTAPTGAWGKLHVYGMVGKLIYTR